MRPKQVIILRKDLAMTKGKMIAQGAHASMKVLLDMGSWDKKKYVMNITENSPVGEWINGAFAKICVYCNSEEELGSFYQQAKDAKIPCSLIVDSGLTHFNGVPTKTAVAIGPWYPDIIDKITGHLKLL